MNLRDSMILANMLSKPNIEHFIQLIRIGNPIIENNIVSNFSTNDYLLLSNFNPNTNFEFKIKFSAINWTSEFNCLLGYRNSGGIIAIGVTNDGRISMQLSTDTTSFNICSIIGTTNIITNINYYCKFSFNGSQYKLELSTDDINYNIECVANSQVLINNGITFDISIGTGHPNNWTFNCLIDLNKTYLIINNTKYKFNISTEEYTILNYIQSNGSQWLDTGVKPDDTTKIQTKFVYEYYNGTVFIGYYNGDDNNDYRFFCYSGSPYFDMVSDRIFGGLSISTTTIYEFELGNYYIKDLTTDNIIVSGSTQTFAERNNNIQIFDGGNYGKMYYCKIYKGNTLVRDYVPARRNSDSKIGMVDRVNNIFYSSSSGADFIGN